MKKKINQLFRDKLVLVMMVLGLLTIVAAAGAVKIRKSEVPDGRNPYLEAPETQGILAENTPGNASGDQTGNQTEEDNVSQARPAGSSDAEYSPNNHSDEAGTPDVGKTEEAAAGQNAAVPLSYNGTDKLGWPVRGNVLIDYSMETTTYFPTLDQYKCNPALIIQGEVSGPVVAPADARVSKVSSNEEIGNYVVLDLGNDYTAVCGQLKDIQVAENQYVTRETMLGYVAEPTKYYSIEGDNVYFGLEHGGKPVDALDYLE